MKNITEAAVFKREVIGGGGLHIVRFCAEWSGPCQIMGPIYEELYGIYGASASFYKIDIDRAPLLTKELGVTELPTILFYHQGVVIDYVMGFISRRSLVEKLEEAIKNV